VRPRGARARALADRFGVPDVFTDLEELLEADACDAVIVATPNHLHEPHVLSALRAGVHVLCERPLALTVRGVERVLAAARKAEAAATGAAARRGWWWGTTTASAPTCRRSPASCARASSAP
jgi:predicted dehydrogenase